MKRLFYILLYLFSILGLTVVGCTNDDVVQSSDSNEITFRVITNEATRTATYVSPSYIYGFNEFHVYACETSGSKNFIRDLLVTRQVDSEKWEAVGPEKYYWSKTSIDFFAFAGCDKCESSELTTYTDKRNTTAINVMEVKNVEVPEDANVQHDFMYATAPKQVKSENSSDPVQLAFYHAYSAISFKAETLVNNLYIYIKSVSIKNIATKGTLIYSPITTYDDYGNSVTGPVWTVSTEHTSKATLTFDDSDLEDDSTADWYFYAADHPYMPRVYAFQEDSHSYDHYRTGELKIEYMWGSYGGDIYYDHDNNGTIFVLPQTVTPWEPTDADTYDATTGAIKRGESYDVGTYVELELCIYNIGDYDDNIYEDKSNEAYHDAAYFYRGASKEIPLYGSIGNYKKILIPLEATWAAGKLYTYNFKFGSTSNTAHGTDDPDAPAFQFIPIELETDISYQDWNDASDEHTIREERHEDDSNNE